MLRRAASLPGDQGRGECRRGVTVGLISDTHGFLRSQAMGALEDSDLIVHAGDVGDAGILESLEMIAPVHAVRSNTDRGELSELPLTRVVEPGPASRWPISGPYLIG